MSVREDFPQTVISGVLGFCAQKQTPGKQTNLFGNSSQSDESGLERQGGIKRREGKKILESKNKNLELELT